MKNFNTSTYKDHINKYLIPYQTGEKSSRAVGNAFSSIRKDLPNLYDHISQLAGKNMAQRVFNFINSIYEPPLCKVERCENRARFNGIFYGYSDTCSKKCACIEKYGVDNPSKSKIVIEKTKKTNQERYGGNAPICSQSVKDKFKETCIQKYGVSHSSKRPEYVEKCRKTNNEKFGADHFMQTESGAKSWRENFAEIHGVDHPMKLDSCKEKVSNYRKAHAAELNAKIWKVRNKNYFRILKDSYENESIEFLFTEDTFDGGYDYSDNSYNFLKYDFLCKTCNNNFQSDFRNIRRDGISCPLCTPGNKSVMEINISQYLTELDPSLKIYNSDRGVISPKELDILLPNQNLAIEFNGLYWHSELSGKDKNYHLNKTNACKDKNVRLIHIFEDEWVNKNAIVKNKLKHILGKNNAPKIYARNCTIREITPKLKNDFLNEFHIQGEDRSKIKLGLFSGSQLVAVMTFASRRNALGKTHTDGEWELCRFATDYKHSVIGGGGKLLAYFKRNFVWSEIISYADLRWTSESKNIYSKLNFELDHISSPGYWYINNGKREHRSKFQKHKLKLLLENFDPTLTEWQNMQIHGYDRIWDCGNLVYKLTNKET